MSLIKDDEKFFLRIGGEPLAGIRPNGVIPLTDHHVLQHGIVGDENVGRRLLNFKAGEKFGVFFSSIVFSVFQPVNEVFQVSFGRNTSEFGKGFQVIPGVIVFGKEFSEFCRQFLVLF